jgi:hypothetical protein
MSSLPKEKRDKIILTAAITLAAMVGVYFFVVRAQHASLQSRKEKIEQTAQKVKNANSLLQNSTKYEQQLRTAEQRLQTLEDTMASGDLYSWVIKTMNRFQAGHKVEIPNYTPPAVGEVGLLPKFPYKAATFALRGTAHFHEFGKFLADFENTFPCMRVQNVDIEPLGILAANPTEQEKVSFKMEIVALIKPTSTP